MASTYRYIIVTKETGIKFIRGPLGLLQALKMFGDAVLFIKCCVCTCVSSANFYLFIINVRLGLMQAGGIYHSLLVCGFNMIQQKSSNIC